MAGADWSSTITVNIVLAALPPARAGFGILMFLVNQDDGNSLNSSRVMSFSSAAEAETAQAAGYISATTLDFLQAAFSQQPTPSKVKVGYRDVTGAETMAAAFAAIRAADDDWYAITAYHRTDAEIVLLADLVEASGSKIYIAQGDDASWLDSGVPSGLSTLADNERTAILYHSADAQPGDIAWAASRLVFDPDVQSAGWEGQVRDVASITAITSAQRDFIATNGGNVGLVYSSADFFVQPGQTFTGRPIYEIVSADWFKARISEDVALLKLQHTQRGEKIIVDSTGQTKILAILNGRLQQGVKAGHFVKGQVRATAESITVDDISNRRLRFKVEAQIAADARLFVFNVYLQPDALQEA
jgi:hypothetical protein